MKSPNAAAVAALAERALRGRLRALAPTEVIAAVVAVVRRVVAVASVVAVVSRVLAFIVAVVSRVVASVVAVVSRVVASVVAVVAHYFRSGAGLWELLEKPCAAATIQAYWRAHPPPPPPQPPPPPPPPRLSRGYGTAAASQYTQLDEAPHARTQYTQLDELPGAQWFFWGGGGGRMSGGAQLKAGERRANGGAKGFLRKLPFFGSSRPSLAVGRGALLGYESVILALFFLPFKNNSFNIPQRIVCFQEARCSATSR
ncbi:hypothetical protein T492DRAFT_1120596 [Pavlovales sp. CCMP2436]|nr:hypothetical protein T492DRAFT_1120596 [Pavlovales sp. CCMP2436]